MLAWALMVAAGSSPPSAITDGLGCAGVALRVEARQSPSQQDSAPDLLPYSPGAPERVQPSARPRAGDVVRLVDRLDGVTAKIAPAGRPTAAKVASSDPAKMLLCQWLQYGGRIMGSAPSPRVADRLAALRGWMGAGRYDFASDVYQAARDLLPGHADAILDEIGLGAQDLELLQAKLETLGADAMRPSSVAVTFEAGSGSFVYRAGTITLDTLGLKRLIVADFLFSKQGFIPLSRCVGGGWPASEEKFCRNLRARVRAEFEAAGEDPPDQPAKVVPDRPLDQSYVLADLFADWRRSFGLTTVESYFDEVWNLLASMERDGCAPDSSCSSADGIEARALDYLNGKHDALVTQLNFVMAHEIAHHLLGHGARPPAQPQNSDGGTGCDEALVTESEADVVGAILVRDVNSTAVETDYWGNPIKFKERRELFFNRDIFIKWSPFFDGYVGMFEARRARCGYFSGQARHILLQTFYVGAVWDQ